MKTMNFLIALFISVICFSQTQFEEKYLPVPSKISIFEVGPLFKPSIYYGATPPNYNGKVILLTHGYIDMNQLYFVKIFKNTFYQDIYNDGYQVIFVNTTRGKGPWVNGKILAESIDIITEKYNVPELYLVAHSNGGKSAEVAMIEYSKNDKVTKAFALGTPFYGTYIADVAQRPAFKWLIDLLGLGKGAELSTTYYCEKVYRPYFDNHPNNKPEKFVVIGGSYPGSSYITPGLAKYVNPLPIAGKIIEKVQGTNDGITPYSSTLRPGAAYVFEENEPLGMVNHLDVSLGQLCWPYIKEYITGNSVNIANRTTNNNSSSVVESDYYLVSSDNIEDNIILDKDSEEVTVEILHKEPNAEVKFISNNSYNVRSRNIASSTSIVDRDEHKTILSITDKEGKVESDSKFVGFVKQKNPIRMTFEKMKYNVGEILKVTFKNTTLSGDISVRGSITKIADLKGGLINSTTEEFTFEKRNDYFYLNTSSFEEGVYSLQIDGERIGDFKRTIISGFTVGKLEYTKSDSEDKNPANEEAVVVYPNSFTSTALLKIKGFDTNISRVNIKIYNFGGILVKRFYVNTKNREDNVYDISDYIADLSSGTYILKVDGFEGIQIVKE